MNGYFVSITNNLLEDKHYEKMGNAVWLYMWLIDRMTDISEGQGIVNGGYPITHAMVRENFGTMNDRQYRRYIAALRDNDYINTVQAKYGLYVTINKPKKQFNKRVSSPDKSVLPKASSPDKKRHSARTKSVVSPDKSVLPLYKDNNNNNNTTHKNNVTEPKAPDPHKELVSKLYYDAVKALDVPVRNHNTLRAKIAEMARDKDRDRIIKYLEFIGGQFGSLEYDFKPSIDEALDIYAKRAKVRNSFSRYIKENNQAPARFGNKL